MLQTLFSQFASFVDFFLNLRRGPLQPPAPEFK